MSFRTSPVPLCHSEVQYHQMVPAFHPNMFIKSMNNFDISKPRLGNGVE